MAESTNIACLQQNTPRMQKPVHLISLSTEYCNVSMPSLKHLTPSPRERFEFLLVLMLIVRTALHLQCCAHAWQ